MIHTFFRRLLAILLVLLLISGFCTVAAAGNTLALDQPDSSGNLPFSVENMFPGDRETRDFTVEVRHKKPVTLYYHAEILPGSEKLAEVMMVTIQLPQQDLTLYDGLMRDMPAALEYPVAEGETQVLYRITAYLDTSVGNDYQYQNLIANFRWWYAEEPQETTSVKLVADKLLDGQYARGSDFTFVLMNEGNHVVQTVSNQDSLVEFDTLTFSREGTYLYTITEKPTGNDKIQYDDTVYTAIVTVTPQGDGLTATVSYEVDGQPYETLPRFRNLTKGTTPQPDPDNPDTGDDTNIWPYVALLGGSGLGIFLLILLGRRKKEASQS